jgi:vancomycin resistance protein YoaR
VTIRPNEADGFAVGIDSSVLRTAIEKAATATERGPKDASITLTDGKPTISPGVTGRTVDWDATEAAAGKALLSDERVWTIAYAETEPEFSTADAEAYGLTEVIGEFTTGGFAYASGQNVRVVAEKVQGALVKPGETFSLNTFTGQRTEAEGYIPAGIIDNGVIGTAVGGGISQFATTLYNAAYFAGMGDVTHTPHSFYISRYPLGREATVYDGQIDLAFANEYDTAVMIQTVWTESDITVRIWGTKHVEVQSETGEPFDYTAPETRTVPYGQSCSPSSGSSGYSVVNTRIIKDLNGEVIRREPFTTVYNGQVQVSCQPPPTPATTAGAPATTAAAGG